MRIRRNTSRVLGTAVFGSIVSGWLPRPYSSPAPEFEAVVPPAPPPPATPPEPFPGSHRWVRGSAVPPTNGQPCCELSRSPWDRIAELGLCDPQEEDSLVDKYMVRLPRQPRSEWFVPSVSVKKTVDEDRSAKPRHAAAAEGKKEDSKGVENETKAEADPEDGDSAAVRGTQVWTCKKNDGRRWQCRRLASRPGSLCDYHLQQRRVTNSIPVPAKYTKKSGAGSDNSGVAMSKASRTKKNLEFIGEGFYYYSGFAPSRSKRHCRSIQEPATPAEQEENGSPPCDKELSAPAAEQEDNSAPSPAPAARRHEPSSDDEVAGIVAMDEEGSHDNVNNMRVCSSGTRRDRNRKRPVKKAVKSRLLKSLT